MSRSSASFAPTSIPPDYRRPAHGAAGTVRKRESLPCRSGAPASLLHGAVFRLSLAFSPQPDELGFISASLDLRHRFPIPKKYNLTKKTRDGLYTHQPKYTKMKRRTFHKRAVTTAFASALGLGGIQSVYAVNSWQAYDPTAVNPQGNPCKSTIDNFISQANPQPPGGFDLTPLGYSYRGSNSNGSANNISCQTALTTWCNLYGFNATQLQSLINQCCIDGGPQS